MFSISDRPSAHKASTQRQPFVLGQLNGPIARCAQYTVWRIGPKSRVEVQHRS
jgi:hypothetical protein